MHRFRFLPALVWLFVLTSVIPAKPDPYPSGPVVIVSPYAAGGGMDVLARLVSVHLGKKWHQRVMVENRPGASGIIGSESVGRSEPNGLTMLLLPEDVMINPAFFKRPENDPVARLIPVSPLASTAYAMVTPKNSEFKTFNDLIKTAKSADVSYGSCGVVSTGRVVGEMMNNLERLRLYHISYRGGCLPALNDVLGAHIKMAVIGAGTISGPLASGQLNALAIASKGRWPFLPQVPTFADLGYPEIAFSSWIGLFVAGGTPATIVEQISSDLAELYRDTDVRKQIEEIGYQPLLIPPREFADLIKRDGGRMAKIMESVDTSEPSR